MYLDLFNLQVHPFRLTPDAEFLYLSPQHAKAKACMEQAGNQRDALVVVTGEVGCGKSVLVNRVISEMSSEVAVARLTQTNLDPEEFLQSVLSQYGLQPFERDKKKLVGLLDNFLFAQNMRQRPVVLIIEEAQNLSKAVLDVVRSFADLEENSEKLISVVLVGQPGLRDKLQGRELKTLSSRVSATAHLEPLSQAETTRLIQHRLKVAGCRTSPFADEVYAEIYSYTGGVPRVIINLCDTALTAAYVEDSPVVSSAILKDAIAELELDRVAEGDPDLDPGQAINEPEVHATLSITERGRPLSEFVVKDTRVLIGRDSDNDITLVSEFISRHHAQIAMDQEGCFSIKDLNSTNGVYVNGVKTQRSNLKDGDRIIMGYHQMVFKDSSVAREQIAGTAEMSDWRDTAVLSHGIDEDDKADSA
ncbi:MAG: AAA family ATPase [Gammaproteobacteria bacterium]|nr:AAA family ATPase [Gammaproteobacteria bacterium]